MIDGLRRLLDVGRSLITELDPEAVFERLLEVARELTGARYAAIGVLDERTRTSTLSHRGIDEDTHRAIGELPARARRSRGADQRRPRPLRLADVGPGAVLRIPLPQPPMTTFLGRADPHRARSVGGLIRRRRRDRRFSCRWRSGHARTRRRPASASPANQRVALLHGELEIASSGAGTIVTAAFATVVHRRSASAAA